MKVLHLSSERTWKGGEQQLAYLLDESRKTGIECHVACRRRSAFEDFCRREEYPSIPLSARTSLSPLSILRVASFCRRRGIDLVHMHSGASHSLAVLAVRLGAPSRLVLSRRIDKPPPPGCFNRWKYNHERIRAIACVSDAVKDMMRPIVRDHAKLVTIYDGIDLDRFRADERGDVLRRTYGVPGERLLIGNTAALLDHKDYVTFIDTAELLLTGGLDAVFFAIGQGRLEEELKRRVREKGLEERILFTGFRTDVPRILPELDLFLMTSKTEGLGSSILDAYASGVPVVATAGGGLTEIVLDEETGLLCPVGQPGALAEAVLRIVRDGTLRSRLTAGAARFVENFSKERMAACYFRLYEAILSPDSS